MIYGIQTFGIRSLIKENTEELYQKLSAVGIQHIEPCVAIGYLGGFEQVIWGVDECIREYGKMQAYGLTIQSVHLFAADILDMTEEIRRLIKAVPVKQVVLKAPDDLSRKGLLECAFTYMALADTLTDLQVKVAVHNQAAEIQTRIDDLSAYEWLIKLGQGKIFMQVDTGWMQAGGEDPETFLWKNKDVISSVHFKDFADFSDLKTEVPFGEGAQDALAVVQFARANGLLQIFDQDNFRPDIFADIQTAVRNASNLGSARTNTISFLNVLNVKTGKIRVLHEFDHVIEAPNWLKTQNAMIYNANGHLFRYDIGTDTTEMIDTGHCTRCNNDHVLSPDEKYIAISCGDPDETGFSSYIFTLPITGGEPKKITEKSPSFLHGWSPDGKELTYCAFRGDNSGGRVVDIYTIPAEGGEERPLITGAFNDGPEYSPDGKDLWFHSTRSGLMQVFRTALDNIAPVQLTEDNNNWFPHISPDGKKVVYITYKEGELLPSEHLPNMQVELWMMDTDGSNKRMLTSLFGGQGTINVNSWNPASDEIAFVSYELKHK